MTFGSVTFGVLALEAVFLVAVAFLGAVVFAVAFGAMALEAVALEAVAFLGAVAFGAVEGALTVRLRLATGERGGEAVLFLGILNYCSLDTRRIGQKVNWISQPMFNAWKPCWQ